MLLIQQNSEVGLLSSLLLKEDSAEPCRQKSDGFLSVTFLNKLAAWTKISGWLPAELIEESQGMGHISRSAVQSRNSIR